MTRTVKVKGISKNGSNIRNMEITAKMKLEGLYGNEWNKKTEEIREEIFDVLRRHFHVSEISMK